MFQLRISFLILIFCAALKLEAQNRIQAQKTIEDLCQESFSGRGYINKGDSIAAEYIRAKFEKLGLAALSPNYLHPFNLDVNTIPELHLELNNKPLKAGYDYLVNPGCPSISIEAKTFYVSLKMLHSKSAARKVKKAIKKGYVPVISLYDSKDPIATASVEEIMKCSKAKIIVFLKDKLTWSVARSQSEIAEIWLLDSAFDPYTEDIKIEIKSEFITNYQSQNVCAYVPGTKYPDSLILLCGHYDHLGKMGEATFYGANDNASGIAMLLDLASYFVENPQEYSIAFVAFAGEEAGLVGSYHFVNSPPETVQLKKIKFVFNMDLMGSGEDGATIVNGSVFKDQFEMLLKINTENQYLTNIKSRGKAANSDHYFFTEMGVPSFFIYLMGDYTHYHVPEDKAENLKLGIYYDASFKLVRDFIIALNELN